MLALRQGQPASLGRAVSSKKTQRARARVRPLVSGASNRMPEVVGEPHQYQQAQSSPAGLGPRGPGRRWAASPRPGSMRLLRCRGRTYTSCHYSLVPGKSISCCVGRQPSAT